MPQFVHHVFGQVSVAYVRRYLERNRRLPDTAPREYIERFRGGGVF